MGDLSKLLASGQYADIWLTAIGGESLPAHRVVLGARSQVFGAMLSSDVWTEAQRAVLPMHCSQEALLAFLQFLYAGAIATMPPPVALEVLELAAEHMLEPLVRSCAVLLARELRRQRLAGSLVDEAFLQDCARLASVHELALMSVPGSGSGALGREVARAELL